MAPLAAMLGMGAVLSASVSTVYVASLCEIYPRWCRPQDGSQPLLPLKRDRSPGTSPTYVPPRRVPVVPFVIGDTALPLKWTVRHLLTPKPALNPAPCGGSSNGAANMSVARTPPPARS